MDKLYLVFHYTTAHTGVCSIVLTKIASQEEGAARSAEAIFRSSSYQCVCFPAKDCAYVSTRLTMILTVESALSRELFIRARSAEGQGTPPSSASAYPFWSHGLPSLPQHFLHDCSPTFPKHWVWPSVLSVGKGEETFVLKHPLVQ